MQKVLTAAEMREVDRLTTEKYGIPSILLMENAAHAVARVITEKLGGSVKGKSILVLCGKGNNGGDGAALARILELDGARPYVLFFGEPSDVIGDAGFNLNFARQLAAFIEVNSFDEWKKWWWDSSTNWDVIVDAIFGTGLSRPVEGLPHDVINFLNDYVEPSHSPCIRLSIDIPSGLSSDSGFLIGSTFRAEVTVALASPKIGNVIPPAAGLNGELVVADIGCDDLATEEQPSMLCVSEESDAVNWLDLSRFTKDSYKNKRGHALLIAGSESFSGAAVLAGNAAMRSGVGLVTVVTPRGSKDSVASRVLPEVMVRGASETQNGAISEDAFEEIKDLLDKASAITIGSGLSQSESTRTFVEMVIEACAQPIVLDADALNLLSPFEGKRERDDPLILTPHEGEFIRLLGTDDKDVLKDRVAAVRGFAQNHNVILVLKGERVLIGEPSGKVVVNPTGNSGLGKAGNGDTLTGILAGFVTQAAAMKIDIFETVVAAVYVAGMAGDVAEKKFGKRVMTASDVRECLSEVFQALNSEK